MNQFRIQQAKRLLDPVIKEISALSPETQVKELREAMKLILDEMTPPPDSLSSGPSLMAYDGQMLDVTRSKFVSIVVRGDGKVIWINNEYQCVLRICQIVGQITLEDPLSKVEYIR